MRKNTRYDDQTDKSFENISEIKVGNGSQREIQKNGKSILTPRKYKTRNDLNLAMDSSVKNTSKYRIQ